MKECGWTVCTKALTLKFWLSQTEKCKQYIDSHVTEKTQNKQKWLTIQRSVSRFSLHSCELQKSRRISRPLNVLQKKACHSNKNRRWARDWQRWKELLLLADCLTFHQHVKCNSGTNLLRQLYVLPHWDRGSWLSVFNAQPTGMVTSGRSLW